MAADWAAWRGSSTDHAPTSQTRSSSVAASTSGHGWYGSPAEMVEAVERETQTLHIEVAYHPNHFFLRQPLER